MIIGISGKARSGKNTFAEMLAEELNLETFPPLVMMAFAHELKTGCQNAFDLSYEQLWGDDKELPDERYPRPVTSSTGTITLHEGFWTGREIMQNYGAFFRTIDNEFWIKHLFKVADEKEYKNAIITDVRYVNEAMFIQHKRGGYVIRVERESKDVVHQEWHPSEVELDNYGDFDFTVNNNGTLDDLRNTAKDVCRFLKVSENDLKKLGILKENDNG